MKLYSVNSGYFKLDGGAMFGVVPKSIWNKLNPADDNNMCSWAMRCLLIEDGKSLILIDNGMGNKQDAKFFGHYYLHGSDTLEKSLAAHGFGKDDITDVFLTHLHFDHCGGSIEKHGDDLIPAFKNATYWSNKIHWQLAEHPNDREKASFLKENILPIKESGQLKFLDLEFPVLNNRSNSFHPQIEILYMHGHTDAMMIPKIDYNGKIVIYAADLLPSAAHIPMPYVMAYDTRPLQTLIEKKAFLDEAGENNYTLFFEHDPAKECCSLEKTEKGVKLKDIFTIDDL